MKLISAFLVCLVRMSVGAAETGPATRPAMEPELVPLDVKLAPHGYDGSWYNFGQWSLERPEAENWTGKLPCFLVPRGSRNLALHRPVTSSEKDPFWGELKQITDGEKEAMDNGVDLGSGLQWIQIDLGRVFNLHAVLIWHNTSFPGLHKDVIVQLSNDAAFEKGVQTIFNNDQDNSSKMGRGNDPEYFEARGTKIIDAKGMAARHVRMYSNGRIQDDSNQYVEVEVYGVAEGEAEAVPRK